MNRAFRKSIVLVALVAVLLLTIAVPSFAQATTSSRFERPRTKYLGDVRATMKRIQELPGIMDNLLCENDPDGYVAERQRLATEIENLKWLLVQMDIKNTLDLQSIQGAVNFN